MTQQSNNAMTNATWKIVIQAISILENPPTWLSELAHRNFDEIIRFPKLDNAAKGEIALPVVEQKVITTDYLDFLREQIRLNARGQQWTDVLQRRLDALQPFVGKMLLTAHFYQKPHSVTLRITPENYEPINAEFL